MTSQVEGLIRPPTHLDINQLHAMYTHPAVARAISTMPDATLAQIEKRVLNQPSHIHHLVAEVDGHVVGIVSLIRGTNPRRAHSGGIGLSVHPDYWGCGIGTKLMEAILELADNWLNLKRIELDVNTDNPAAIRLYEKLGFEREGIKRKHIYGGGRWADSYLMARIRE